MTKITTDKMTDARALEVIRFDALEVDAARRMAGAGHWPQRKKMSEEAIAHIAARLASTSPAPDGWVLVPMAVTAEMASAASRAARNSQVDGHKIIAIWKAMIDAAPQPVVEKDNG